MTVVPLLALSLGMTTLHAQNNTEDQDKPATAKPVTIVSYDELEKNVEFDLTPITSKGGVVVSHADTLEEVMPAVVTIYSTKKVHARPRVQQSPLFQDPMMRRFFGIPEGEEGRGFEPPAQKQQGLGSGVVISKDGYILTNNHVIEGADEIMVSLPTDQRDYEAELIGADPKTDVALIKISSKAELKTVSIGDSKVLRVGDVVLAVGNPFGLEQTVTSGIVSALGRSSLGITGNGYENFIQTDAAINLGNSGGALIDANGRLVGINTAIQAGRTGGNLGIAFAIPSNMVFDIVERMLDGGGEVRRGFLGVFLKELDSKMAAALGRDDKSGVLIREVGADTPAQRAGLKSGDLIIAMNGEPVIALTKLRLDISNTPPGEEVMFTLIRNGKEKSVDVVLGDLESGALALGAPNQQNSPDEAEPADDQELVAGVVIGDLSDEVRLALEVGEDFDGVIVESVTADSLAAADGLVAGMIIKQVNQRDVSTVEEALDAAKSAKNALLLQVHFRGRVDIIAISLE